MPALTLPSIVDELYSTNFIAVQVFVHSWTPYGSVYNMGGLTLDILFMNPHALG